MKRHMSPLSVPYATCTQMHAIPHCDCKHCVMWLVIWQFFCCYYCLLSSLVSLLLLLLLLEMMGVYPPPGFSLFKFLLFSFHTKPLSCPTSYILFYSITHPYLLSSLPLSSPPLPSPLLPLLSFPLRSKKDFDYTKSGTIGLEEFVNMYHMLIYVKSVSEQQTLLHNVRILHVYT